MSDLNNITFFDLLQNEKESCQNQKSRDFRKVHCLFEQSGTFKKEFISLGIPAEDYDIKNDFGETDHVVDIFKEIENAYDGKKSIFDKVSQDDLSFAFFPCVRFEDMILLSFRGQLNGMQSWTLQKKMRNCIKLQAELTHMYVLINKLFIVYLDRGLKLIVENPFSEQHYLRRYWCISPEIIDFDRRERGDYFKKPTQYFFVNFKPHHNFVSKKGVWNAIDCKDAITKIKKADIEETGAPNIKVARSMIHPEYANRFIKEFIL